MASKSTTTQTQKTTFAFTPPTSRNNRNSRKYFCRTNASTTRGTSTSTSRRQKIQMVGHGRVEATASGWSGGADHVKDRTPSSSSSSSSYDWKRIKGFLFDIDGTLADTDPLHIVAFRDHLKKVGSKHVVTEQFFKDNISGRSNPDIARDLLPELSEEEKKQWIIDKEAYFCDLARKEIKPVDGLLHLIQWIKANDIKCAAVTNAPRTNAEMLLEGLNLTDAFDLLVIANEIENGKRNKPHPDPYLNAMKGLDVKPEECVVIEDSVPGATAGVAAGVHTIGILTTQTEAAMKEVGAKQTIFNFHELMDEIKECCGGTS